MAFFELLPVRTVGPAGPHSAKKKRHKAINYLNTYVRKIRKHRILIYMGVKKHAGSLVFRSSWKKKHHKLHL